MTDRALRPVEGEIERRFTQDKSTWGDGPWQFEPDLLRWEDPPTGLACLIRRNGGGALCGYVGITAKHDLYGADDSYGRQYSTLGEEVLDGVVHDLQCHGGVTYGRWDSQEKLWFIGFDCAHSGDLSPAYRTMLREVGGSTGGTYKDIRYVKREVESLARQLFEPLAALASCMDEE